jgi:hypothetical protein
MTTTEQHIFVCEKLLGWTQIRMAVRGSGAPERKPSPHGIPPGKNYEAPLPSLTLDLIWACEEKLDNEKNLLKDEEGFQSQRNLYRENLEHMIEPTCAEEDIYWHTVHATKEQRLAALAQTINLVI